MTNPKKNDQDKKIEDQFQNTRGALDQDIMALSGKLGPAASSSSANSPMSQPPSVEAISKTNQPGTRPAELEARTKETREAVADDVKALREKFTPENLKEDAKGLLVEAKDGAVDTMIEAKDKAVETLVEAKDATLQKVVETKDVVVEKLHDYEHVVADAASDVADQAVRAGKATWRFARQNALPLALIGVGASWLIASGRKSRRPAESETDYRSTTDDYGDATDQLDRDALSSVGARARMEAPPSSRPQHASTRSTPSNGGSARRSARSRMAERTEHEAKNAGEQVKDAGHAVKDMATRTGERVEDAYDRASRAVRTQAVRTRDFTQRQYVRARDSSRELIRENPLAVGALAVATGIGIGMLLPSTSSENEMYGEARDRLVGEARDAVAGIREAAQDVGDVANDTTRAIL